MIYDIKIESWTSLCNVCITFCMVIFQVITALMSTQYMPVTNCPDVWKNKELRTFQCSHYGYHTQYGVEFSVTPSLQPLYLHAHVDILKWKGCCNLVKEWWPWYF